MNSWTWALLTSFLSVDGTTFKFEEYCKKIKQIANEDLNLVLLSIDLDLVSAMRDCYLTTENPSLHRAYSRCENAPALTLKVLNDLYDFLIPIQQVCFAKKNFVNPNFIVISEQECFEFLSSQSQSSLVIKRLASQNQSEYYSNNIFFIQKDNYKEFLVSESSVKNLMDSGILDKNLKFTADEKSILKYKIKNI